MNNIHVGPRITAGKPVTYDADQWILLSDGQDIVDARFTVELIPDRRAAIKATKSKYVR